MSSIKTPATVRERLLALRPDRGGPLSGTIVLDFTFNMAGPFCTLLLADLGALVVKVEPPTGEPHRWMGAGQGAMGRPWALVNRDKLSLSLDMKDPEDRRSFFEPLAQVADVVVHNFKPDTAARLRIDEQSIRELNPEAVHCAISGFGAGDEGARLAGVDIVAEAYTGLASVTAAPDGPVKIGVPLGDVATGLLATIEILGRVVARLRGEGMAGAEVALIDGATAFGTFNIALAAGGERVGAVGRDHQFMAPYGYYRTGSAGWIALGLANDRHWTVLCECIGAPQLEHDPRFETMPLRWERRDELRSILEAAFASADAFAWESRLSDAGLPCAAARSYDEVLASPILAARGVLRKADNPELGAVVDVHPLSFSRSFDDVPARPLGSDRKAIWTCIHTEA